MDPQIKHWKNVDACVFVLKGSNPIMYISCSLIFVVYLNPMNAGVCE